MRRECFYPVERMLQRFDEVIECVPAHITAVGGEQFD
jgi:hypothetical protein